MLLTRCPLPCLMIWAKKQRQKQRQSVGSGPWFTLTLIFINLLFTLLKKYVLPVKWDSFIVRLDIWFLACQWNVNALPAWECVKPQWLESDCMYSSDCLQVLITFINEVFLTRGKTHQVHFTESSSIPGWILYAQKSCCEFSLFPATPEPCSQCCADKLFGAAYKYKGCWIDSQRRFSKQAGHRQAMKISSFLKKAQAGTEVLPSMPDWFFSFRLVKQRFCVFPELQAPMPWGNWLTVTELWLETAVCKIQEHQAPTQCCHYLASLLVFKQLLPKKQTFQKTEPSNGRLQIYQLFIWTHLESKMNKIFAFSSPDVNSR